MPTLVIRFALIDTEEEISPARHAIVEAVRDWGIALDDDTADAIRLIASELITNAVVHGEPPVQVGLSHQPGRLLIEVFDANPHGPLVSGAGAEDEGGRGTELVGLLAERSGWEASDCGKRVWAEVALPKPTLAVEDAGFHRFLTAGQRRVCTGWTEGACSPTFAMAALS
ncbi:ATP-binding protein [Streptomyces pathocidini]|uniref:ATP-binding protein n=1 Tax=Streptomyces pathocidini TaxID=1650571 RepID=UPI0033F467F4